MNAQHLLNELYLNEAGWHTFKDFDLFDYASARDVCKNFITGSPPVEKATPRVAEHLNPDNTPKGYLLSWWIQRFRNYVSNLRYGGEWIALIDSISFNSLELSNKEQAQLVAQWLVRFHDLRAKTKTTQTNISRVFIIVTACLNNRKALNNYRPCALVNLKRNGPEGWSFEGKCHLFGGAVNPSELPIEAAARELEEELPGLLLDPQQLTLLDTINEFAFYTYHIGMISEQDVRNIAYSCQEGMLDVRFSPSHFNDWISPVVPTLISTALSRI